MTEQRKFSTELHCQARNQHRTELVKGYLCCARSECRQIRKLFPSFYLSIMVRNPFEALPGFAGSNPGEAQKSYFPNLENL
jgi:hypothetical protein